jgi:hypothetical protein
MFDMKESHKAPTMDSKHTKPNQKMTNDHLLAHITSQLTECGVQIVALPGGCLRLLGRYGSILLSHDLLTLRPHHIERLCS